jgi:hypothetical protein
VTGDRGEPLDELRHHWGSAYMIACHPGGRWVAERRDAYEPLRAASPEALWDKIRADYAARPVPRDLPGRQRTR